MTPTGQSKGCGYVSNSLFSDLQHTITNASASVSSNSLPMKRLKMPSSSCPRACSSAVRSTCARLVHPTILERQILLLNRIAKQSPALVPRLSPARSGWPWPRMGTAPLHSVLHTMDHLVKVQTQGISSTSGMSVMVSHSFFSLSNF